MSDNAQTATPQGGDFFVKLGFGVAAAVVGGVCLWSIAAPIESAVIAGGQVVVESNRKTVQHLEGGVIGDILVREGDIVSQGAVLATLEDTTQRANVGLIDSQLTELYARRARLEAERDGADAPAPTHGAPEILGSPLFQEKLKGQRQLFDARRRTRLTQISLLEERAVQQNERIGGLEAQITSLRDQTILIDDELESVRQLYEEGLAPKTRLRSLEREAKALTGRRGALAGSVAEAQSIIAEARLEIERLHEAGREEAITELRNAEVSISELEERRIAALDALRRTEIRAPQSGRVLGLAVHTVGGVIAPGAPLMEIVPDGDRLQIAARIAPQDVDKVEAGQETLVRFSAFGMRHTPEVKGTVIQVSADSLTGAETDLPYYLVLVEIPEGDRLEEALGDRRLIPGMPVETFIRTGSRPAVSYLLKPLTDAMARSMRED